MAPAGKKREERRRADPAQQPLAAAAKQRQNLSTLDAAVTVVRGVRELRKLPGTTSTATGPRELLVDGAAGPAEGLEASNRPVDRQAQAQLYHALPSSAESRTDPLDEPHEGGLHVFRHGHDHLGCKNPRNDVPRRVGKRHRWQAGGVPRCLYRFLR